MLFLEAENPKKDIHLYVNSPGGSVSSTLAIIDTMNHIKNDVSTICVGMAASGGAWILSSGTKGKRMSLPNSEIMIHQPLSGSEGQVTDMEIKLKQLIRMKENLTKLMAKNTGQPIAKVEKDLDRDFWLTADEAKKYGIIDKVLV
jgi:ATP-dependent Clp protease protease subunit